MALKFRRGTTAQKSGSLAFGEPFVNTDLNTLQIGGPSGDITLGTTGESSAFAGVSVSASSFISGSGLKITGNAAIDGNLTLGGAITIGDATADTVNVVASLSSSLIPSDDNAFEVGSSSKRYRNVYATEIDTSHITLTSGSATSIHLVNTTANTEYNIRNTVGGGFAIFNKFGNKEIISCISASVEDKEYIYLGGDLFVSGNIDSNPNSEFTASIFSGSIAGIGNVSSYSSSVNSRLVVVEGVSASAASALNNVSGAFATTVSSLGGDYATDAELSAVSAAVATTISNLGNTYATDAELSAVSSAVAVRDAAQDVLISSLQSNIVSASVFNTFSTSVDSRIATEKGRVDAILSASTADADTFAEIVTLINSVDTTSDAVFGGFVTSSNATNNVQNARLSALETETGSIATAQSAQNARLTSLETTSGSHNSRLSDLEGFSSSLNSTFATDVELSSVSGAFATSQAAQDVLITSLRNNVVSASVFTTFSTSVDSRLDSVELVSASAAGALNSVSGAFATTIGNLDNTYATDASVTSVSGAFATTIGNLGSTYATDAELSAVSSAVAVRDAGQDTTISTLSSSVNSRLVVVEGVSASAASALNSVSGAFNTTIQNLGSTYATDAELSSLSASVATRNAGQDTTISTLSSSVDSRLDVVEGVSASAASALNSLSSSASSAYAKVGAANTFNGNQTISGSLIVTQDLIIGGSASIQHVTSSQLNISDNIITVNTINPTVRFGGLAVIDSGSAGISGSFLYDSVQDEFVFVHKGDGTNITSSHFLVGPETYNNLGNETYLSVNKVLKSNGNEHVIESNITDNGTTITLGSNTSVTGTLVATGTSLVSASAQITLSSTTGYSTFSSSVAATDAAQDTTISTLSSSVNSRLLVVEAVSQSAASALNSFSASNAATDATQTTNITTATTAAAGAFASASAYSASAAVVDAAQDVLIASLRNNVVSASVFTTFSTSVDSRLDSVELVSASAAGALNSVSGAFATTIGNLGSTYATDAELSSVSGAIATRDAGQDTTISTLSSSVASRLGTLEGKDITITLTGDVTGTGTITDLGNVSFATTVAANSVALGTDTTGNYVATITAGTGVSSTGATTGEGIAHTISIGQAVATSDNVRFNSLGIGMAASATAGRIDATNDIVAFSSSDIRFKENIKPIENAIDKIRKISGNTYDWKEENKIEHGYEGNDVGVIAQEIEAVLPQLVQTRENGFKAVKYDKLVALLIEGIKEQQLQIEQLRIDLDNCRNKGL